jgi:hypothetical protein
VRPTLQAAAFADAPPPRSVGRTLLGGWLPTALQYGVAAAGAVMLFDSHVKGQAHSLGSVAPWDPYPILWWFIAGLSVVALVTAWQQWGVVTGRRSPLGLLAQNVRLTAAGVAGLGIAFWAWEPYSAEAAPVVFCIAAGLLWLAGSLTARAPATGFDRLLSIASPLIAAAVAGSVAYVSTSMTDEDKLSLFVPVLMAVALVGVIGLVHWITRRGRPHALVLGLAVLAVVGFAALFSFIGIGLPLLFVEMRDGVIARLSTVPDRLLYGTDVYSYEFTGWIGDLTIAAFVILGAIISIGNIAAIVRLAGGWWGKRRAAS